MTVPVPVTGNTADDACTPSHTRRLYDAFTQADKRMHEVRGAPHYYVGPDQQPKLAEAIAVITSWLGERGWAAKTAD